MANELGSHDYTVWVNEGHGLAGRFDPAGDSKLVRLEILPEGTVTAWPEDKFYLFFRRGADLKRTAETFRTLAKQIDDYLYPTLDLEEALEMGLSMGVMG